MTPRAAAAACPGTAADARCEVCARRCPALPWRRAAPPPPPQRHRGRANDEGRCEAGRAEGRSPRTRARPRAAAGTLARAIAATGSAHTIASSAHMHVAGPRRVREVYETDDDPKRYCPPAATARVARPSCPPPTGTTPTSSSGPAWKAARASLRSTPSTAVRTSPPQSARSKPTGRARQAEPMPAPRPRQALPPQAPGRRMGPARPTTPRWLAFCLDCSSPGPGPVERAAPSSWRDKHYPAGAGAAAGITPRAQPPSASP